MFNNDKRQEERTGRYGTPRLQYLQELVTQFQNSTSEEAKERLVANLPNFAYDPYSYTFLCQLNVLELFVDSITEPNEKLVEFGIGGACNSCADPQNAAIITQCGGIPLVVQCLSLKPSRKTLLFNLCNASAQVNYALGTLYSLCNKYNRKEILKPAAAEAVSVSFSNLAKTFMEKHVPEEN